MTEFTSCCNSATPFWSYTSHCSSKACSSSGWWNEILNYYISASASAVCIICIHYMHSYVHTYIHTWDGMVEPIGMVLLNQNIKVIFITRIFTMHSYWNTHQQMYWQSYIDFFMIYTTFLSLYLDIFYLLARNPQLWRNLPTYLNSVTLRFFFKKRFKLLLLIHLISTQNSSSKS